MSNSGRKAEQGGQPGKLSVQNNPWLRRDAEKKSQRQRPAKLGAQAVSHSAKTPPSVKKTQPVSAKEEGRGKTKEVAQGGQIKRWALPSTEKQHKATAPSSKKPQKPNERQEASAGKGEATKERAKSSGAVGKKSSGWIGRQKQMTTTKENGSTVPKWKQKQQGSGEQKLSATKPEKRGEVVETQNAGKVPKWRQKQQKGVLKDDPADEPKAKKLGVKSGGAAVQNKQNFRGRNEQKAERKSGKSRSRSPRGFVKERQSVKKSKAIAAAEAFSRQIGGDDEEEDQSRPPPNFRAKGGPKAMTSGKEPQTVSGRSDTMQALLLRWDPRRVMDGPHSPRASKPRTLIENRRGMNTSIQRRPPEEPLPIPGRSASTVQVMRTESSPAKEAFLKRQVEHRKGLKKILLAKRPKNLPKWAILARNMGLATSIAYQVFGALAMGWAGKTSSRFNTPIEKEFLRTVDYVGPAAIGLGCFLHFLEVYFGLKISAERSLFFAIIYTGSVVLVAFSNAMIFPSVLSFMTVVLKVVALRRAEEGHLKIKPRSKCSSCWIDWSSSHTYLMIFYFLVNVVVFLIRFFYYYSYVMQPCLKHNVETNCISMFGVVAKGFGNTLNLNCSCIFFPVMRVLMSKFAKTNNQSIRLNAQRLVSQNITIHRTIGWLVGLGTVGHVCCHYINLGMRADVTIGFFGKTSIYTGIMLLAVFTVMLAGLESTIKRAHYAVFWKTHYFFLPFVLVLLAHAPEFWKWMVAPMVFFFVEKYYSKFVRGQTKFYVMEVEYLHPVTTLKFRPERDEDFRFEEGQYLLINVPHVAEYEWHPFTISSAYDDLSQSDYGYVSISMKVTGPNRWTDKVKDYLKELSGKMRYLKDEEGQYVLDQQGDLIADPTTRYEDFNSSHTRRDSKGKRLKSSFHHLDSKGKHRPGMLNGTDGKRLIYIDGPFQAPTQSYSNYDDVMLVGSGIGLTPASAILRAVLRHKWKKGFKPRTLRFYWVLSHKEIGSYRWFIRLITRLLASYEFDKRNGALKFGSGENENYIEMNLYITSVPDNFDGRRLDNLTAASAALEPTSEVDGQIMKIQKDLGISEQDIHEAMLRPTNPSSEQFEIQVYDDEKYPVNPHFNDMHIWVWKGRPKWEDIFHQVKVRTAEYSDGDQVGVCFCGNPVISQDLKKQCKKQSSRTVSFFLHSETFG